MEHLFLLAVVNGCITGELNLARQAGSVGRTDLAACRDNIGNKGVMLGLGSGWCASFQAVPLVQARKGL